VLVDVELLKYQDPIFSLIAQVNDQEELGTVHLEKGFYKIGHWNFDSLVADQLDKYPGSLPEGVSCYGVCDSPEQFKKRVNLEESFRKFVVSFVPIRKRNQPSEGGWRWHKWGEYIGEQEPTQEYLFDEPKIEQVFTYHIYEVEN